MHFTKTALDAMKFDGTTPKARCLRWDDEVPGFGVRLWDSGKKTFFFSYRFGTRQRYMTLGPYGVLTLQQARSMALEAKVQVLQGKDPLELRQKKHEGKAFPELVKAYLARHAAHKKTGKEDERLINGHLLPAFKSRPLASIRSSDVAQLHHAIGEKTPIQANRMVALVSKMFSLAITWGFLPESFRNPAKGIQRFRENERERFVSPAEIKQLWLAIGTEKNLFIRTALQAYLFVGMRKTELLRLRWKDVDFVRKAIYLPDTKAGRSHTLPLTTHMEALLMGLPRIAGNPHVFVGHTKGEHLTSLDKSWHTIRAKAELPDVWIHDLRRTVGSWLASSGYSLPQIGKVLNHSNPSTTQRYARFQLTSAAEALESHGNRLQAALNAPDDQESPPSAGIDGEGESPL